MVHGQRAVGWLAAAAHLKNIPALAGRVATVAATERCGRTCHNISCHGRGEARNATSAGRCWRRGRVRGRVTAGRGSRLSVGLGRHAHGFLRLLLARAVDLCECGGAAGCLALRKLGVVDLAQHAAEDDRAHGDENGAEGSERDDGRLHDADGGRVVDAHDCEVERGQRNASLGAADAGRVDVVLALWGERHVEQVEHNDHHEERQDDPDRHPEPFAAEGSGGGAGHPEGCGNDVR
mmetsp:Transcript_18697/g.52802  ORF Transcript_18697/g.52802 Transcript_18697/m.52802 type:complete len:236 (-) Transcript_18697:163-870(-)